MRFYFFLTAAATLAAGCASTSWHDTLSAGGESIKTGATRVWHGAGSLWPDGVWPDGVWVADYERAEQMAAESNKGILFLFTGTDRTREDPLRDALEDAAARGVASNYVPALLFHRNEPDRRYAAQFDVNRAPALIVWHPDGTYHARQGVSSQQQAAEFLAGAAPPGATPKINPHVSRRLGFAWHRDWASARQASQESGRPVFVVLERWMTRDWDSLRPMIERREVYARVAGMIHCRPTTAWSSGDGVAAELGIDNLPAIAIVPPDGPPRTLELPSNYESIVRFMDGPTATP